MDDLDIDVDIDFDLDDYSDDTSSTSLDFTVTIDPPEGWTKETHSGNALLNYQKVEKKPLMFACSQFIVIPTQVTTL